MRVLIDPSLPDSRKLWRFADSLGIQRVQAVGHVTALWCWTMRLAESGKLGDATASEIARAGLWEGDAQAFVDALEAVHFLDRTDGVLEVHQWIEHQGDIIAKRERDRERKRRSNSSTSGGIPLGLHEESTPLPCAVPGKEEKEGIGMEGNGAAPEEIRDLELYAVDTKLCEGFGALRATWAAAYPGLDVMAEIRKAHAWELSNPANRKKDRPRFLNGWLTRAANGNGKGNGHAKEGQERRPRVETRY